MVLSHRIVFYAKVWVSENLRKSMVKRSAHERSVSEIDGRNCGQSPSAALLWQPAGLDSSPDSVHHPLSGTVASVEPVLLGDRLAVKCFEWWSNEAEQSLVLLAPWLERWRRLLPGAVVEFYILAPGWRLETSVEVHRTDRHIRRHRPYRVHRNDRRYRCERWFEWSLVLLVGEQHAEDGRRMHDRYKRARVCKDNQGNTREDSCSDRVVPLARLRHTERRHWFSDENDRGTWKGVYSHHYTSLDDAASMFCIDLIWVGQKKNEATTWGESY